MDPVERAIRRAASDRRMGAAAIERRLIGELLEARPAWSPARLAAAAERLLAGQPAMANLRRLAGELAASDPDPVERTLQSRRAVLDRLGERLAEAAWPVVKNARRVLTLSRSSAVAAVLTSASQRGWRGEVVVFDGSPAGRGEDQANELGRTITDVRSRPDAAMTVELAGAGCMVVVGADAVGQSRFVNVCGTAMLVELAAARAVPTVLVADTGKDLPEAAIDEILGVLPVAGDPETGRTWPLFEPVGLDRVTERVTE